MNLSFGAFFAAHKATKKKITFNEINFTFYVKMHEQEVKCDNQITEIRYKFFASKFSQLHENCCVRVPYLFHHKNMFFILCMHFFLSWEIFAYLQFIQKFCLVPVSRSHYCK